MAYRLTLAIFILCFTASALSQELDCDVSITDAQALTAEARDNLVDFAQQLKDYMNKHRWTKEGIEGGEKIKCAIQIKFLGAPTDNHYSAQAFVGSQRPIFKLGRNTATMRVLDEKWEFEYSRYQSLTHDEYRFDPLLSFLDYYAYVIIGYDFDSYKSGDGTPYFQKAFEIVNKARGTTAGSKGWESAVRGSFSRGQLVEELLNPKYQDFREATFKYHYRGLDNLYKNEVKARKHALAGLEMISNLVEKVNQQSLIIRTFFDTKYMEIAEIFQKDPSADIYARLAKIDPAHQTTYDEVAAKR